MKHTFSLLLAVLLTLCLFACGKTPEQIWQEQYDIGMRYLSELNYEEAIVAFTAAIEAEPKNTAAYLGRAEAYVAKAKVSAPPSTEVKDWPEDLVALYKQAENDYLAAIGMDKELAEAYLKLADLYIEQGEPDKAREILEEGFDATGDEAIARKLEELPPADSSPALGEENPPEGSGARTERVLAEDGLEWLYEYDVNGELLRMTLTQTDNGCTVVQIYNPQGRMLSISWEWESPEEGGAAYQLAEYLDEEARRPCHEKRIWGNGAVEEYDYTYDGGSVSIWARYDSAELNVHSGDTIPYTLQNPGAGVSCGGGSWGGGEGLNDLSISEVDANGQTLCSALVEPDGTVISRW